MPPGSSRAGSPFLLSGLILATCILLLAFMMVMYPALPTQLPEPTITGIIVPVPPVPVPSAGGVNIAYELELVTSNASALIPEKIEVLDPATGTVLFSATDDLFTLLYHPAADPPPTAAELQNATGKLIEPRISIWFTVPPDNVPDRLVHRLTLNGTSRDMPSFTFTGGEVRVKKDLTPVVIGPPLRGSGWLATETTSMVTHHFLSQISVGGVPRVPQRYAQDWNYVDPETGDVASGNISQPGNFLGYGKEVYAVANGTVAWVCEGIPDNEPVFTFPPLEMATAAGNAVILDIGNDKYACYAHFIPGSVKVKSGDQVREGQVIGLLGNSGNSGNPHLHFQVVTGDPTFLASEGYPHVYRSFGVIGTVNWTPRFLESLQPGFTPDLMWKDFGELVEFLPKPDTREMELPENNVVVRFP